jgi:MoaA/NifB/PqqE/SkfB family radical SAM enzyme
MHPKTANLYRRVQSGASYRLRGLAGGRFASFCRPVSIGLLISERCNARCVHCDIWKNRGQEDSPSVDQWKNLLREFFAWLGPVHVVISGGEALLRPWTPELVAYGSSLGLFIEVLTHGYWMEQSRIEQMAMARPSRITVSVDAIGATHSLIRGREKFWDYTLATLNNLTRLRSERRLGYSIRLKTVIMDQNLDEVAAVAHFAAANGMDVFYQPIEQNYNTAEDSGWFEHAATWPRDKENAVRRVEELIRLKQRGSPIANSMPQLQAMIPYFRDPDSMRVRVQGHAGHEKSPQCAALTTIQVQSNGDVSPCCSLPPVGNIRKMPIREIWDSRPKWWEHGCCMEKRFSEAEKQKALVAIQR